jgi:hypothetical protein
MSECPQGEIGPVGPIGPSLTPEEVAALLATLEPYRPRERRRSILPLIVGALALAALVCWIVVILFSQ